jgi:hypothetical protein
MIKTAAKPKFGYGSADLIIEVNRGDAYPDLIALSQ